MCSFLIEVASIALEGFGGQRDIYTARMSVSTRLPSNIQRYSTRDEIVWRNKCLLTPLIHSEFKGKVKYGGVMETLLNSVLRDGNDNSFDSEAMFHYKLSTGGQTFQSTGCIIH